MTEYVSCTHQYTAPRDVNGRRFILCRECFVGLGKAYLNEARPITSERWEVRWTAPGGEKGREPYESLERARRRREEISPHYVRRIVHCFRRRGAGRERARLVALLRRASIKIEAMRDVYEHERHDSDKLWHLKPLLADIEQELAKHE